MRLLSFDTSSKALSVAIAEDGRILAESNYQGDTSAKADRQESVSLLVPTIDELTRKAGLKKEDLGAITVGIGPGGFTGVRVAVVTARTLAQALRLPLIGVNSLEVASYGAPSAVEPAGGVVHQASKSHCFVARYERVPFEGDFYDLKALQSPVYMTIEDFKNQLAQEQNSRWWADGPVIQMLPDHLSVLQEMVAVNNIAACQAKIAHVRLSLKVMEKADLLLSFPYQLVQPLYLRGASVTLKKGDVIERVETH